MATGRGLQGLAGEDGDRLGLLGLPQPEGSCGQLAFVVLTGLEAEVPTEQSSLRQVVDLLVSQ